MKNDNFESLRQSKESSPINAFLQMGEEEDTLHDAIFKSAIQNEGDKFRIKQEE